MEAVKGELLARGLGDKFDNNTNWTNLLKILKEHEKNKKYFTPLTNYDAFKWNCNQVSPDGELLQILFELWRYKDKIVSVIHWI